MIHEVEVPVAVETVEAPAPEVVAQVVEEPETAQPTRARNGNRNRNGMQGETMRDRHDMAFERMEECGDDPLCMLD